MYPSAFNCKTAGFARTVYLCPIPVAARSKSWVCGRLFNEIADSNPAGARMFVSCKYCVLSGSATGRYLVKWSPTNCVRTCAFVRVRACVSLRVITYKNNRLHLQYAGSQRSQ